MTASIFAGGNDIIVILFALFVIGVIGVGIPVAIIMGIRAVFLARRERKDRTRL